MLSFYDSRTLAKKLHIPLARFKRWTREFLPPDNLGGYQSGYARQHNINEAFRVYLAGFLVHNAKLSVPQAKMALDRLGRRLPNLFGAFKPEDVQGLKLALVLDAGGGVLCQLQNGARLVYEDEDFQANVTDFVRVVLLGNLLLRFVGSLNEE